MQWVWTFPTLSVLLRPRGTEAMLIDPTYDGWQPFDPVAAVPDLSNYDNSGGICLTN